MPTRLPASIVMLHSVSRPSIDMSRIASPAYSIAYPVPPAALIWRMIAMMTSLAVTPKPSLSETLMRIVRGFICQSVCVAITWATCEAPIPNAMHPSAPCVEVWLSPHTIVSPGSVMPCSGPTTCAMPCRLSPHGKTVTPNSSQLDLMLLAISRARGSARSSSDAVCVGV